MNDPDFRSTYFDIGNGPVEIQPLETRVLASRVVSKYYAGVLTGLSSKNFETGQNRNLIGIGLSLEINGEPVPDFGMFTKEREIMRPLVSESQVVLRATNYSREAVVLTGRLLGYTFPTEPGIDR